jgi:hypothetical protein
MSRRDTTPEEQLLDLQRRVAELERMLVGRLALLQPVGVAASSPGSVVKKIEVFDAAGVSLGFVAVYDTIT